MIDRPNADTSPGLMAKRDALNGQNRCTASSSASPDAPPTAEARHKGESKGRGEGEGSADVTLPPIPGSHDRALKRPAVADRQAICVRTASG